MPATHRRLALALTTTLIGVAAACGSQEQSAQSTTADIEVVAATIEQAPGDPAAATTAGDAVTSFGIDLYSELRSSTGNLAVSPYSIAAALAMTRAGARGTTADEMDTVLHADLVDDLDVAFGSLDAELATRPGEFPTADGDALTLDLSFGNALWPQTGFAFEQEFLDALAVHYGAGVNVVDYVADTEAARKAINGWVADQTRDRIPELIVPGVLGSATRLVLTNALYLNAPWEFPFNASGTQPGDFTTVAGAVIDVPVMTLSEHLAYAAGDQWQAVRLPYVGATLSMTVFVPDAGQFDDVEARLDADQLSEVNALFAPTRVDLRLPSWEYRVQVGLNETLRALGMVEAFELDADFSAMSAEALFVSDVVHEVFVSVDEDGTEAAAATAVVMAETAAPADEPVRLDVDRPFVYWITDDATGATLFLGRVLNPIS